MTKPTAETTPNVTPTRRQILGGLAAAGLLAGAPAHAGSALQHAPLGADTNYLARMLAGLTVGEPFYGDWVLVDAYPPIAGGVTLVIARGTTGQPLRVDVVRRAESVRAPAATDFLELYTMDGGGGVRVLPDDLMDALVALADHLEDNEAQGRLASRLLTHSERRKRFPAYMDRAATDVSPVPPRVLRERAEKGVDLGTGEIGPPER